MVARMGGEEEGGVEVEEMGFMAMQRSGVGLGIGGGWWSANIFGVCILGCWYFCNDQVSHR